MVTVMISTMTEHTYMLPCADISLNALHAPTQSSNLFCKVGSIIDQCYKNLKHIEIISFTQGQSLKVSESEFEPNPQLLIKALQCPGEKSIPRRKNSKCQVHFFFFCKSCSGIGSNQIIASFS